MSGAIYRSRRSSSSY